MPFFSLFFQKIANFFLDFQNDYKSFFTKCYFFTLKVQRLTEASVNAVSPALEQAVRNSLSASRQSIENR